MKYGPDKDVGGHNGNNDDNGNGGKTADLTKVNPT
jgi:hypothetical protein